MAELSDSGGLLMYEVPAGPTGGLINDLWQRVVADTGMVGPDRGKGGKFLVVLEGTKAPESHGADFVVTSKTNTVLIGTRRFKRFGRCLPPLYCPCAAVFGVPSGRKKGV